MTRHSRIETQAASARPAAAKGASKPKERARRPSSSSNGHELPETQATRAVAADAAIAQPKPMPGSQRRHSNGGPSSIETQCANAARDHVGHMPSEPQAHHADVIASIQNLWRRRQAWHRAEKSLTLAAGAPCRGLCGGDKALGRELLKRIEDGETETTELDTVAVAIVTPLLNARGSLREQREGVEKHLAQLATSLPIWTQWAEPIPKFGALGLAGLVGECGDIGSYKSVSAIWKRMGVAVIGGERQQRRKGLAAKEQGFSPSRRSVLWNIGNSLIGAVVGGGPRPFVGEDISKRDDWSEWQKLFVARMRVEVARVTETWNGAEHKRPESTEKKTGKLREGFSKHVSSRAKRYVEKKFIARLYVAWRREAWDDSKFGDGHQVCETQPTIAVAADVAIDHSKPIWQTQRRPSKRNGHIRPETQRVHAVAVAAGDHASNEPHVSGVPGGIL